MRLSVASLAAVALLAFGSSASATTVTLSTVSSDGTPASQLDASLDFSVAGNDLTLTVTNTGSDGFNLNQVYFNGSGLVTSLSLTSATHNVAGVITAAWSPVEVGSSADGFGTFNFALTDGVGETNPNVLNDGESIVFVLAITGAGGYADADFIVANGSGYLAAAKFTNGPPDPECATAVFPTEQCPEGIATEDSAFGTTTDVPEPATGLLLALGLAGLTFAGRKST
jgi:hypothetical protein